MKTLKYSARNSVSKSGVNYVKTIVDEANSIFTEFPQQNEIGIDALIEFIKDERPTGKCVGVQIKSGNSFYNERLDECVIPVDNHAEYWLNYPLPVFGIVYVPAKSCGYWVNIKDNLERNRDASSIKFKCTRANIFSSESFIRIFMPNAVGYIPETFPFDEALDLFRSRNSDESNLGMYILFRLYSDRNLVWDEFISYFRQTPCEQIPPIFIYYLAHIPWHGDIFGGRDKITKQSRAYAESLIHTFNKSDVVKLLGLIDERGIERGTAGQSIEAIVSSLPSSNRILTEIVQDASISLPVREGAVLIFAYNNQQIARELQSSIHLLESLSRQSDIAAMILADLKEYGGISLY
jgi:hypothetical protein